MNLDAVVEYPQMQQFATQVEAAASIKENFSGDQSDEFYRGMASAFAASYQMAGLPNGRHVIGMSLALVCDHLCLHAS